MPVTCFPLYTPATSIITKSSTPKPSSFSTSTSKKLPIYHHSFTCKASASPSSSITDFDLYDLLGIDSSSNQSQIKTAYRALQKRCHPDIAGPAGHDMAIILNEAYSVLSDTGSRMAYDKEQAKMAELRGYTGKPLYSVWLGSGTEQRAVFVDEVKCVGCLKCALFADKTFAIESVYGRARVVAQWADSEHKILEAIEACPVDCISIVERSDLAALEFLMSKQPRGNVRVGVGNTVGARVSNIFVDVKKFQTRFVDAMDKESKEAELRREARMSAIHAIKSISKWWYWAQSPNAGAPLGESQRNLTHISRKSSEPNINKLRDAAAARKQVRESSRITGARIPSSYMYDDEYWIPSRQALPASSNNSYSSRVASKPLQTNEKKETDDQIYEIYRRKRNWIEWGIPVVAATIAAAIVRLQVGDKVVGEITEHVGGSLALTMVNSAWLQVILAGITWYLIGSAMVELIEFIRNR
ncbi:chaperone protein dnaJ C76, chloroplastic [Durio zibethinus]|uniref:Chaperone protein dnaJ C76, chloroplastic n=1 Tax=Durio zibethinus TaxID=66656 RepID=A0A6P6ACC3_DURZI|nr:chaperone protein dnaJ C76, chloroplastic [Durio zibethinus]